MDYNSNIAVFGDHCRAIGIESELILDYTFFDDQDVVLLSRMTQLASKNHHVFARVHGPLYATELSGKVLFCY